MSATESLNAIFFKGSIDIVKSEPAKYAASLQPKPQVTPVAAAAPAGVKDTKHAQRESDDARLSSADRV
jgi:hypothetical protein